MQDDSGSPSAQSTVNPAGTSSADGQSPRGPPDQNTSAVSPVEMSEQEAIAGIRDLRSMVETFGYALTSPDASQAGFVEKIEAGASDTGFQYQISRNGRMLFMRITPEFDSTALNPVMGTIQEVRKVMAEVGPKYPGVEFGLTGIEVMEADETAAADWDSTWTTSLAAVLISIFVALAFHSVRLPAIAMVSLFVGIGWTFGFLTLSIGHLQILSVVFVLLLLGMGIDYAVLLSSSYEVQRHNFPDDREGFKAAMRQTFVTMGPGIITGCLTAALAFATTLPTKFTGVAEMGLISGMGLLLCLTSMFTVFPALLTLLHWQASKVTPREGRLIRVFDERIPLFFSSRPKTTIGIATVLCLLSVAAMSQKEFDYDLKELQPRGVDSIQWQDRIINDSGESVWIGVSITHSLDEARKLADAYRKLSTVNGVGGIGLLFPDHDKEKVAAIEKVKARLEPSLNKALQQTEQQTADEANKKPGFLAGLFGQSGDVVGQMKSLRTGLGIYTKIADIPAPILAELKQLDSSITGIIDRYDKLPADTQKQNLSRLSTWYHDWRLRSLRQIKQMFDTSPLTLADVPAELMEPYIDPAGRMALEIVPKLPTDQNLTGALDGRFMPLFIKQMQTVDPLVTGTINQIYQSGFLIKQTYQFAGLVALLIVIIILYIDFRSFHDTLCAMFPVAIGFGITFGIMWIIDAKINAANIIVLPLMFGIGVSAGVNIVHRYRSDPTLRPLGLTKGTGKGVTVTSITSMIGFGCMMMASHRGIASLGFVLCTGLGMTLLASYTVLPAWLELRNKASRP
jgi:hopanoid biosynthesis associated RND transporter like protein HpnN